MCVHASVHISLPASVCICVCVCKSKVFKGEVTCGDEEGHSRTWGQISVHMACFLSLCLNPEKPTFQLPHKIVNRFSGWREDKIILSRVSSCRQSNQNSRKTKWESWQVSKIRGSFHEELLIFLYSVVLFLSGILFCMKLSLPVGFLVGRKTTRVIVREAGAFLQENCRRSDCSMLFGGILW